MIATRSPMLSRPLLLGPSRSIVPVLMGGGIRLFEDLGTQAVELEAPR